MCDLCRSVTHLKPHTELLLGGLRWPCNLEQCSAATHVHTHTHTLLKLHSRDLQAWTEADGRWHFWHLADTLTRAVTSQQPPFKKNHVNVQPIKKYSRRHTNISLSDGHLTTGGGGSASSCGFTHKTPHRLKLENKMFKKYSKPVWALTTSVCWLSLGCKPQHLSSLTATLALNNKNNKTHLKNGWRFNIKHWVRWGRHWAVNVRSKRLFK